jgi:hypothetical protein
VNSLTSAELADVQLSQSLNDWRKIAITLIDLDAHDFDQPSTLAVQASHPVLTGHKGRCTLYAPYIKIEYVHHPYHYSSSSSGTDGLGPSTNIRPLPRTSRRFL